MNRIAVLILLLCLPAVVMAQQTIETLTIDQAVALALKHNRLLLNEELEIEKAADQLAAARTRRLPEFDLTVFQAQLLSPLDFEFRRGVLGAYPNLGPIPSQDTDISRGRKLTTLVFGRASQPLSQLPRINLGIRLQESRRELAESRLSAQRQTVINQTRRLCYGLLQKQSALAAAEETIALYRELDRVVGEYVVQQVALESESLEVKARLAREEYEALTLRHALESQREQLNHLLGRDLRTEFNLSPATESAFLEIDLPAAQSRALLQRAEVSEARLKLKQAEYDQLLKQSERWPEVSYGNRRSERQRARHRHRSDNRSGRRTGANHFIAEG
jgi:outer membrane protein TolC